MRRSLRPNFAFTLVELMISIGIALVLMLGINLVFGAASKTVGAGNSLLGSTRDARTVLQTLLDDLNFVDAVPGAGSTAGDAPFFIIYSQHQYAYRNPQKQRDAASQTDPATDAAIYATYPLNQASVALPDDRSHRVDRLLFFTRNLGVRQTNSTLSQYVSTTSGNEALVMLGHAQEPDLSAFQNAANPNAWHNPGQGNALTNPNNYFSSDWMLSRLAIILAPNKQPLEGNALVDNSANGQGLTPLSAASVSSAVPPQLINTGTSDFAPTSIALYGQKSRTNGIATHVVGNSGDWWDQFMYRVQASPYVLPGTAASSKITAGSLARCSPDLIRGCSQFIVEYAGNYYTKDPNGSGNAVDTQNAAGAHVPVPDPSGALDYYTTDSGGNVILPGAALPLPSPLFRHTRWYGFPRSTTGTFGRVDATTGDVVPLRDVLLSQNASWGMIYADAERITFSGSTTQWPGSTPNKYWTAFTPSSDENAPYTYAAAWGPDVVNQPFPKLIRITIELDDHEGRLSQPQRYEFVFEVQK